MTTQPPAGDAEPELLAVPVARAQIEAGSAQPAYGQILELVAGVEDPQQPTIELLARVLGRQGDLVRKPPGAGLADPAAAQVVSRRLRPAGGLQRPVDQGVDPQPGIGDRAGPAVDEAGAGV
jgi:hypothetical protein